MKKIYVYLTDYKKECVFAPLFKMLEAGFELFVPLVIASLIDNGIVNKNTNYIFKMCGLLILLSLIGVTCSITAQYFSAKAATGFAAKLRMALFSHLQKLSYTEIDNLGTSTMITRMTSDVNQVQSGVNMTLRLFLRSPFIVFGAVVMAFTIDKKSSLIFVAAIAVLTLIITVIMRVSVPMMKNVQKQLDKITGITRENLNGVRVIRAFGCEEKELKQFHNENGFLTKLQKTAGSVSALLNPMTYMVINAAIIWLIWTGAVEVQLGTLKQGEVVALYQYMSQILVELIKFANLLVTINKALACANRISDVFEIETSMKEGSQNTCKDKEYAVEFDNVGLTYDGSGAPSLSDIDFKAKPGSVTGIIGGTGCGKTSVVNLIARFYDATEGCVKIFGRDVKDYNYDALHNIIHVVPQKAVLFKGTIRDNMKFSNEDATDEEIINALKISQSWEIVEKKGGLDALIEQEGRNLSGGQRQRFTIARALVGNPSIIILDDSSSALDYATDKKLRESLKALPHSPALFIVSQRTVSIKNADNIIVLDDGRMISKGTHDELLSDCGVYQEIYYSQYSKEENRA